MQLYGFTRIPITSLRSENGMQRKEAKSMDERMEKMLREKYPNHIPLKVASKFLAVSPRQLSKLIADERKPFCEIGANIGTKQKYARIYTGRMIKYLKGELPYD